MTSGARRIAPRDGRARGTAVESTLAVDPHDPARLSAAWQQDRDAAGGAAGLGFTTSADGGATWSAPETVPGLARCDGGRAARVSDPWLTIDAAGTDSLEGLAVPANGGFPGRILVARRGADGSWTTATAARAPRRGFLDKPVLAADPVLLDGPGGRRSRTRRCAPTAAPSSSPAWGRRAARAVHSGSGASRGGTSVDGRGRPAVLDDVRTRHGTIAELWRRSPAGWRRTVVSPPFPILRAPLTSQGHMIGDYQGIAGLPAGYALAPVVVPPGGGAQAVFARADG